MGYKGALRSIQTELRRAERDAQRRQRELEKQHKQLEKMQELERAAYEVQVGTGKKFNLPNHLPNRQNLTPTKN